MIVRFDCGCVGLVGVQGAPLVIYPCDLNDPECWEPLGLHPRPNLASKGYEPLSDEKAAELVRDLNTLVGDGYRFRRVRSLLSG
jgi:hypothetical protein